MPLFAPVVYGLQRLHRGCRMTRHRHDDSYAAIVLEGGYEEAGDCGRFLARPGDVLFHGRFEGHANWVGERGALILNVPLRADFHTHSPAGRIKDPDRLVRATEREGAERASALLEEVSAGFATALDWPDHLAIALAADPSLRLDAWTEQRGLAPATVSRGFRRAYGVPPSRFRLELRTRLAWRQLVCDESPLAEVAQRSGFADQAHLTRAMRSLTGRSPGEWRKSRQVRSRQRASAMA